MTDAPTREEIALYARNIGLTLPAAYLDELASAYANVRILIATMPTGRPHGDEPAHIFDPAKFQPVSAADVKA
jgi:hypothetical protein